MSGSKPKSSRANRPPQSATQVVGFRLPIPIAQAIKSEATKRQLPLNLLLEEMWAIYREIKRAG